MKQTVQIGVLAIQRICACAFPLPAFAASEVTGIHFSGAIGAAVRRSSVPATASARSARRPSRAWPASLKSPVRFRPP